MNEQARAELVVAATAGDADALQRLIVEYHDALRGVVASAMRPEIARYLDADDVLQEAYASAFQSIDRCCFEGVGGFYKWLERIALNQLKDEVGALKRRKRDIGRRARTRPPLASTCPDLLDRFAADQSTPSQQFARGEATAAVVSCLARLTSDQRAVVRMRFLQGRSVAEIATELQKSDQAIHMLCHRGLKRLRGLLVSITQFLSRP